MAHLLIIRKATGTRLPKLTQARRQAIEDNLATARVRRPELEEFILSDLFRELPATNTTELGGMLVQNEPMRTASLDAIGWEIPYGSLGRTKRADEKTAESIRIWIRDRIGSDIIPQDALAIAVGASQEV